MHGAGVANQKLVRPLADELAKQHIPSLTFDFSGHGASSANTQSTLKKRVSEASHLYETISDSCDTVIAFSMSGYVALHLVKKYPIRHLILFAPALYDVGAYDVPFGPRFSEVIRAHKSWRRSDVSQLLSNYAGTLDVIIGEHDQVIPQEVVSMIYSAAHLSTDRRIHTLLGVEHRIARTMMKNAVLRLAIADMVANAIG